MADQQQADKVETETQPAPTPSAEQKTSTPAAEEASPQGDSTSQANVEESQLPDGAKERTTQQFDKLREDLKSERERRIKAEQTFNTMLDPKQPKPQTQPQPKVDRDWYNPETNQVDVNKLQKYNQYLETQVGDLTQKVQGIAGTEQRKQEVETYKAYPELDPQAGNKFNPDFSDAVQGALTSAFLRGETPSFKEVADKIANFAGKQVKEAEKKGATEAIEQLTPKEQASLEATGRSDKRTDVQEDIQQLQQKTRHGDLNAVMARMKGTSS